MTSACAVRPHKCRCNCHAQFESDNPTSFLHMAAAQNNHLIEWEEFLNRVASRDATSEDEATSSPESEDDIIPDEEDRLLRFRMLQKQGWFVSRKSSSLLSCIIASF